MDWDDNDEGVRDGRADGGWNAVALDAAAVAAAAAAEVPRLEWTVVVGPAATTSTISDMWS